MKLRALLVFLASSIACFGQSSILVTNLSEQRELAREFVQELLALRPETNSSVKGVMKIRDAKGKTTKIPLKCEVTVYTTHWLNNYTAFRNFEGLIRAEGLSIDHTNNLANGYFHPYGFVSGTEKGQDLRWRQVTYLPTAGETPFANSDFWLADLGLEFLHWPEQHMTKKEMRRGQFCKVIESTNPQ